MKSYNVSMRSDSNYPPMTDAEWYNAPFNEDDDEEIEVLCVISYQKVLKVKPSDLDYDEITRLYFQYLLIANNTQYFYFFVLILVKWCIIPFRICHWRIITVTPHTYIITFHFQTFLKYQLKDYIYHCKMLRCKNHHHQGFFDFFAHNLIMFFFGRDYLNDLTIAYYCKYLYLFIFFTIHIAIPLRL